MQEALDNKVLSKIKKQHIKPLSKSFFSFKRGLLWLSVTAFFALSSLAAALIITILHYGDWDIYSRFFDNPILFLLLVFPYFWLLIFVAFIYLAFKRIRQSKYGYRYNFLWLLTGGILVSLLGGWLLYNSHLGINLENYLADNFKSYNKINYMRGAWQNPEKGLLAGEIKTVLAGGLLVLDLEGKNWLVDIRGARIKMGVELTEGKKIKILGSYEGQDMFRAEEIRSWQCGCPMCAKNPESDCGGACEAGSCSGAASCQGEVK